MRVRVRAAARVGASRRCATGVYLLPNLFTTGGPLRRLLLDHRDARRREYPPAAMCILVAHVFDGLDGRIARLTHTASRSASSTTRSPIWSRSASRRASWSTRGRSSRWGRWGWLAASLYVTCGALRLARFNVQVDTVEKRHFVGLPIPAAADMIASTVLLYYFFGGEGATHKHLICCW